LTEPLRVTLVGLVAGGPSGVARYAAALSRGLDRVAPAFPDLRLTLLTNPAGAEAVSPRALDVSVLRFGCERARSGPARLALEHLAARRAKGELLHFFDTTGPVLAPRRPFVATAHDATVAYGFNRRRGGYKLRLYPWALARAKAVVAVSEFARGEVAEHFGADPDRVHVVHSGPGFTPQDDGAGPSRREPFLLYVGNLAANKNLPFLVRAFGSSRATGRLVLAGRPGEGFDVLEDELARSPRRADVEVRTDVDDAEVDRLYRTATALVLPSVYEGFGFTPLEAMARGCPVVASDIPAVREISGSGALLVPLEEEAWRDALGRVTADADLRDELTERGRETVGRYSWEETARGVLRLFSQLGASVRRGR
jgi:glycosyltransferase involved in cell wall biosynthesis